MFSKTLNLHIKTLMNQDNFIFLITPSVIAVAEYCSWKMQKWVPENVFALKLIIELSTPLIDAFSIALAKYLLLKEADKVILNDLLIRKLSMFPDILIKWLFSSMMKKFLEEC